MGEGGDDFYYDGLSLPSAIKYCTACPAKELLNCELLAISAAAAAATAAAATAAAATAAAAAAAAAAAGILLNGHKTLT